MLLAERAGGLTELAGENCPDVADMLAFVKGSLLGYDGVVLTHRRELASESVTSDRHNVEPAPKGRATSVF